MAAGRTYSYADMDDASDRLAGHLQSLGLGRGARVALHLRNGVEYPIAELAILKIAAVRIPLNELMGREELAYCLRHSSADVLISHADLPTPHAAHGDVLPPHRISVPTSGRSRQGETPWADAVGAEPISEMVVAEAGDTAIIQYTGGTTGHPKGVHHIYGRMAVCLLAHIVCGDIRADEVMLLTTPLPHSA